MNMLYKWKLNWYDTTLHLPTGTQVLSAKIVDNEIVVWVSQPINVPNSQEYNFLCRNTGNEAPEGYTFIDTCIESGIVWHIFVKEIYDAWVNVLDIYQAAVA